MSTAPRPAPTTRRSRRLWGLRERPGRLALALFRVPLRVYRSHPERLPRDTFVKFVHTGRKSGQPHEAVAMLLRYDQATREAIICAAWGPDTDWVRNLRGGPALSVQIGRDSFIPEHRFLTEQEAFEVATGFRHAHPARLRLVSAILGWGSLRDDNAVRSFVRTHPFVAFHPASAVNT